MAIPADSFLTDLQADFYQRLLSDSFLSQVPILSRDLGDLDNQIANALQGGVPRDGETVSGGFIAIHAVDVVGISGDTPMPIMAVEIRLECAENVLKNRNATRGTQITAHQMAARCVQLFHNSHIHDRATGIRLARTSTLGLPPGEIGVEVVFRTDGSAFDGVANVDQVDMSQDAGEVTLTCGTAGATIYYTTDGSFPGSANANVSTYSAPFSPGSGTVVRAAAEKADLNPSKYVNQLTVD